MTAFRYDAALGTLTDFQTISTLPPGESVAKGTSTAEVQIHPSGKFLYGSNRGHNTIVAYAIDATSGKLTLIDHHSTLGKTRATSPSTPPAPGSSRRIKTATRSPFSASTQNPAVSPRPAPSSKSRNRSAPSSCQCHHDHANSNPRSR